MADERILDVDSGRNLRGQRVVLLLVSDPPDHAIVRKTYTGGSLDDLRIRTRRRRMRVPRWAARLAFRSAARKLLTSV